MLNDRSRFTICPRKCYVGQIGIQVRYWNPITTCPISFSCGECTQEIVSLFIDFLWSGRKVGNLNWILVLPFIGLKETL